MYLSNDNMLHALGLLAIFYGGWWFGSMFTIGPIRKHPRVLGGYMIGFGLAGIGIVLVIQP